MFFRLNNRADTARSNHLNTANEKLQKLLRVHLQALAVARAAGRSAQYHGTVSSKSWDLELQSFANDVFAPVLSHDEKKAVGTVGLVSFVTEHIEGPIQWKLARMAAARLVHPPDTVQSARVTNKSISSPSAVGANGLVSRGLIIREEPLAHILAGAKSWEMRGKHTKIRGPIALIQKGSKAVFAVADLVDSIGPLSRDEMLRTVQFHGILPSRIDLPEVADYRYAWKLQNSRKLPRPVPYIHKGGVVFVTLDDSAMEEIRLAVGKS